MTDSAMTLDRFKQRLDAYGSALERWPLADRDEATRLLASSPPAQAWLIQAQRLDRVLELPAEEAVSVALQARIAAIPARYPRAVHDSAEGWLFGHPWRTVLALAASTFGGVFSGWWSVSADETPADATLEASAWGSPAAQELSGLLAIGFSWDLEGGESELDSAGLSGSGAQEQEATSPDQDLSVPPREEP